MRHYAQFPANLGSRQLLRGGSRIAVLQTYICRSDRVRDSARRNRSDGRRKPPRICRVTASRPFRAPRHTFMSWAPGRRGKLSLSICPGGKSFFRDILPLRETIGANGRGAVVAQLRPIDLEESRAILSLIGPFRPILPERKMRWNPNGVRVFRHRRAVGFSRLSGLHVDQTPGGVLCSKRFARGSRRLRCN